MKRTPELFDQIEAYINLELSEEQRLDFELLIKQDSALRKEVALHKRLHSTIANKEVLNFKSQLKTIGESLKETDFTKRVNKAENTDSRSVFSFNWKMAASVALIVGLLGSFWYNNNTHENDLYAANYVPYPVEGNLRGTRVNESETLQNALKFYKSKKYEEASVLLAQIVSKSPSKEELKVYLGNCYLSLGQTENAIKILAQISESNQYTEVAKWYTALGYIQQNNNVSAQKTLKELVKYDGLYGDQAIKILQKIK